LISVWGKKGNQAIADTVLTCSWSSHRSEGIILAVPAAGVALKAVHFGIGSLTRMERKLDQIRSLP
jgi:hypothetical protein